MERHVEIAPPVVDYALLMPIAVPALGAMLLLVLGAATTTGRRLHAAVSVGSCLLAAVLLAALWGTQRQSFSGMLSVDGFFVYSGSLLLAVTALSAVIAVPYMEWERLQGAEYFALLLFSATGGLVMLAASSLLSLVLGLELLSLPLYVLTGYALGRRASGEAAMKYFLLGAFSVGFMVYGVALIYAAGGTLEYARLAPVLRALTPVGVGGLVLVLVGFAFKLALAPFHMWTPDAYTGAPTSVTAFMSVATKIAAFGALLRFALTLPPSASYTLTAALAVLSGMTMLWGNIAAVVQTDIKRLLAYSSIGQAGYLLTAFLGGAAGQAAVSFYLLAYAVTNLGVFALVLALGDERLAVSSYEGLGRRRPWLAALLSVLLLSLAGVPPTAGFWAKLFAFRAAVAGGYTLTAVLGLVTSAVAAYYYVRIILMMYTRDTAEPASRTRVPAALGLVLGLAVLTTVALGVLPDLPSALTQAGVLAIPGATAAR